MSLEALINIQNEDGSFNLDSNFAECIGLELEKLVETGETFGWSKSLWATSLALGYFNEKCQESVTIWQNAGRKCNDWLKSNVTGERVPEDSIEYVVETGKNFIYNMLVSESIGPVPYRPLVNPSKIK